MIAILVAVLMWMLVLSLLILRRGREERSITWAALTIAISVTLNIDVVYLGVDPVLGGTNLVTLFADLALMTGVFFLGRGVLKAAEHPPLLVRVALGRVAFAIAVVAAAVAFFLIDRGATTTTFMLDLGDQAAAATYSMLHFTYYAIVLIAMAAVAARYARPSHGILAVPPILLVVGCALGVTLTLEVYVMDLAHVTGNLNLMLAASSAYGTVYLLTFLFLCSGFAGQPVARTIQARKRARRTRDLSHQLDPVWLAATTLRPGISQVAGAPIDASDPEALLHRQVVEIRDAMIDGRVSFELDDRDRMLLEAAERHLVGEDPAARSPRVDA
ncbi:hypothetical protein [Agromyces seonyuensis]|uniref:Histidine kinase N-terminal 7TM region domain-containing protein n=1 Tax=Agromyces seonyuensis TaxID=2662446 RepID=A0A6I4NYM1_9MICO|nr:hypothetical protein [Agromyces seonyuensis]MWB99423.1 hypothetical protein [Agromyces seonyuensis]